MFAGIKIPLDQPWSSISKFVLTTEPSYPFAPPTEELFPFPREGVWPPTPVPPTPTPVPVPIEFLRPGAQTITQEGCARCGSLLEITRQVLAPQWQKEVICPICGYNLGFRAIDFKVLERKPWPPSPIPEPPMPRQVTCPQCISTLKIIPPSPRTMVTQAFTWLTCPVCGYPELVRVPTGGYRVGIVEERPKPDGAWFIKQINDALDQYKEKIIELEEALRTAQAAEFYNNPYGTIEAHAQTLLNQLSANRLTVQWPLELSTRWSNLFRRLQKLIIDARTAAKQRRPIPTYSEEVGTQQDEWITDAIYQLQELGLPFGDIRVFYPQPGQIGINGRAILPTEEGIPPTWETYTEYPVGIPDYSVEQRMQEASEQEAWQLAEAVPVAPPKKIYPYLILAGLGVTTAAVWYYKKKKKRAR